jgi:hypothetical protein
MDNLTNRRFIKAEHSREDPGTIGMADLQNHRFKDIVFPLSYEQRYHIFR